MILFILVDLEEDTAFFLEDTKHNSAFILYNIAQSILSMFREHLKFTIPCEEVFFTKNGLLHQEILDMYIALQVCLLALLSSTNIESCIYVYSIWTPRDGV